MKIVSALLCTNQAKARRARSPRLVLPHSRHDERVLPRLRALRPLRSATVLDNRHRQLVGLGHRVRGRAETVGYLDLGPAFLLALAERDRLHEQPNELLALLKPLGRVLLDFVQALPERG